MLEGLGWLDSGALESGSIGVLKNRYQHIAAVDGSQLSDYAWI
jgi:hypothetical protein